MKATSSQKVEMVFKTIEIHYWQQGVNRKLPGALSERRDFQVGHPGRRGVANPTDGG